MSDAMRILSEVEALSNDTSLAGNGIKESPRETDAVVYI